MLHTVIDDHSRVAYVKICADEKAQTAIAVLQRAVAWFAERGVIVERVLSDNGSCYRSYAWRDACTVLGITHKRTRPYRPQTNGKIEQFPRTLADGWAYARRYGSKTERRATLPNWIHFYNHHRIHSAIGGTPPQQAQQPAWTSQLTHALVFMRCNADSPAHTPSAEQGRHAQVHSRDRARRVLRHGCGFGHCSGSPLARRTAASWAFNWARHR